MNLLIGCLSRTKKKKKQKNSLLLPSWILNPSPPPVFRRRHFLPVCHLRLPLQPWPHEWMGAFVLTERSQVMRQSHHSYGRYAGIYGWVVWLVHSAWLRFGFHPSH